MMKYLKLLLYPFCLICGGHEWRRTIKGERFSNVKYCKICGIEGKVRAYKRRAKE